MTPSQVAIRAAQLISQRGLTKGRNQDEEGALCHNGAVYMAVAEDEEDKQLALEVIGRSALVMQRQHSHLQQPHQLNDLPETSAEDIILLLKENAALDDDLPAMAEIADRRKSGEFHQKPDFPLPFILPSFPSSVSITPFS